jgi:hypothetical protein
MKKILIRLIIVLVLLVIIGVVVVGLSLDRIAKAGIETVGSKLTGVEVKVDSVGLSVFSGKGSVNGFVVGNPSGFKSPYAMKLDKASLALRPRSIFGDKIIINSIKLEAPEITFEMNSLDPRANNLSKILANVEGVKSSGQVASSSPSAPAQPAPTAAQQTKESRKLEVDEFVITGAKIHISSQLAGGEVLAQAIPDIHLRDLGTGPEGITPADLAQKVLEALKDEAAKAAAGSLTDLNKGALYVPKDFKPAASNAVNKVTKGLGDLLKK